MKPVAPVTKTRSGMDQGPGIVALRNHFWFSRPGDAEGGIIPADPARQCGRIGRVNQIFHHRIIRQAEKPMRNAARDKDSIIRAAIQRDGNMAQLKQAWHRL